MSRPPGRESMESVLRDPRGAFSSWPHGKRVSATPARLQAKRAAPAAAQNNLMEPDTRTAGGRFPGKTKFVPGRASRLTYLFPRGIPSGLKPCLVELP